MEEFFGSQRNENNNIVADEIPKRTFDPGSCYVGDATAATTATAGLTRFAAYRSGGEVWIRRTVAWHLPPAIDARSAHIDFRHFAISPYRKRR